MIYIALVDGPTYEERGLTLIIVSQHWKSFLAVK